MELENYLRESKIKRKSTISAANKYLCNATGDSEFKGLSTQENTEIYQGPTPLKLREFESQVNHQLKKIYSPDLENEELTRKKIIKIVSVNERIKKTYSKGTPGKRKKLLEIIPKNNFIKYLNIPSQISCTKNFSISPDKTIKIHQENKKNISVQRGVKKNFLLPILTTVGTHEERDKIYKYR